MREFKKGCTIDSIVFHLPLLQPSQSPLGWRELSFLSEHTCQPLCKHPERTRNKDIKVSWTSFFKCSRWHCGATLSLQHPLLLSLLICKVATKFWNSASTKWNKHCHFTLTLTSAPEAPGISSAIFLRLMPRVRFIFLEWIFRMSRRA